MPMPPLSTLKRGDAEQRANSDLARFELQVREKAEQDENVVELGCSKDANGQPEGSDPIHVGKRRHARWPSSQTDAKQSVGPSRFGALQGGRPNSTRLATFDARGDKKNWCEPSPRRRWKTSTPSCQTEEQVLLDLVRLCPWHSQLVGEYVGGGQCRHRLPCNAMLSKTFQGGTARAALSTGTRTCSATAAPTG